jgi:hypothetical protein
MVKGGSNKLSVPIHSSICARKGLASDPARAESVGSLVKGAIAIFDAEMSTAYGTPLRGVDPSLFRSWIGGSDTDGQEIKAMFLVFVHVINGLWLNVLLFSNTK